MEQNRYFNLLKAFGHNDIPSYIGTMVVLKKVRKIEKRTLKNTCHSKSIIMRILSVNLLKKMRIFIKKTGKNLFHTELDSWHGSLLSIAFRIRDPSSQCVLNTNWLRTDVRGLVIAVQMKIFWGKTRSNFL